MAMAQHQRMKAANGVMWRNAGQPMWQYGSKR